MHKPIAVVASILIVAALSGGLALLPGPMSVAAGSVSSTLGARRDPGRLAARPAPAPRITPRATRAVSRATPVVKTAVTRTPVATVRGGNSTDAKQVIETYARDELGIAVTVMRAGSSVIPNLTLSTEAQAAVDAAAELAATTYGAVLTQGGASVSFGSGSVGGDLSAELDYGSLGALAVTATSHPPASASAALSLLQTTFPALSGMSYQPLTSTKLSYSFYATLRDSALNPKTGKIQTVAVAALMGTATVKQKVLVWVVLGRGQFATAIAKPT